MSVHCQSGQHRASHRTLARIKTNHRLKWNTSSCVVGNDFCDLIHILHATKHRLASGFRQRGEGGGLTIDTGGTQSPSMASLRFFQPLRNTAELPGQGLGRPGSTGPGRHRERCTRARCRNGRAVTGTVGVQEKDGVCAIGPPMIVVNRMVAIEVAPGRNQVCITIPDGAGIICRVQHASNTVSTSFTDGTMSDGRCNSQGIRVLAESVQAWSMGQLRPEPQVLSLEDERGRRGVEQRLDAMAAIARDRKAEGLGHIVKGEGGMGDGSRRGASEDGSRDLVDLGGIILDLDMETRIYARGVVSTVLDTDYGKGHTALVLDGQD
nr:hypothetical protein CFP56_20645 [Quercus suber]